jgi:endonuclease YncB( thermonuclease family)
VIYLYLTKDVGPIPKGTVERFREDKAEVLVKDGSAIVYDPKKHSKKPTAPRLGKRVRKA